MKSTLSKTQGTVWKLREKTLNKSYNRIFFNVFGVLRIEYFPNFVSRQHFHYETLNIRYIHNNLKNRKLCSGLN